jgi:hypothetical protein
VTLVLPGLALDDALELDAFPLPEAEPHAASTRLTAAAAATASQLRRATRLAERRDLSGMVSSWSPLTQLSKHLDNISNLPPY